MSVIFYLFYSLVTLIVGILVAPFFLLHKRGRRRLKERLGLIKCKNFSKEKVIWFHAASLGELKGLEHIILDCMKNNKQFILSAISISALDYFERKYADNKNCLLTFLLPFDSPIFYRKIFSSFNVKSFIYAESEFWPVLILKLTKAKIPIVGLNVKLSFKAYKINLLLKNIFKEFHNNFKLFCIVNNDTKNYLLKLNISSDKIKLTGNMKYAELNSVKQEVDSEIFNFNNNLPKLVIGSIRKGEELIIFEVLKKIEKQIKFNIVLAPRQLEQVSYFVNLLKKYDFNYVLRTEPLTQFKQDDSHNFLVLNTLGELNSYYEVSDISLIGGSLVSGYGGHNPLEAAKYKVPVLLGSYFSNVEDLVIEEPAAFTIIREAKDLERSLINYDSTQLKQSANNAYSLYQRKQNIPSVVRSILEENLEF